MTQSTSSLLVRNRANSSENGVTVFDLARIRSNSSEKRLEFSMVARMRPNNSRNGTCREGGGGKINEICIAKNSLYFVQTRMGGWGN